LRFLSHAETLRLFRRACVRAEVKVAYSQGFNPHQRMSLVLPRSVGVESEDELLCVCVEEGDENINVERLKDTLPAGIEIVSAQTGQINKTPEPVSARYIIKTKSAAVGIKERVENLLTNKQLVIQRKTGEDDRSKTVDVRPFLEAIKAEAGEFTVDCKISQAGTIRVDEILGLLHLKTADLTGPVRRTNVQWKGL
jgi:radical SAM-linked protein